MLLFPCIVLYGRGWKNTTFKNTNHTYENRSEFMERTFLMVKPDGVQRNLIGEIVARFEKKGFQLLVAN